MLINRDGIDITGGALVLPGNAELNPFGLLRIKTQDARLEFNLAESTAKLKGRYVIPSLNNFTLDLTTDPGVTPGEWCQHRDHLDVDLTATRDPFLESACT